MFFSLPIVFKILAKPEVEINLARFQVYLSVTNKRRGLFKEVLETCFIQIMVSNFLTSSKAYKKVAKQKQCLIGSPVKKIII